MKIASDSNLRNVETVERLGAIFRLPLAFLFRAVCGEFRNSIKFEKFAATLCEANLEAKTVFGKGGNLKSNNITARPYITLPKGHNLPLLPIPSRRLKRSF